ncbi:MAG: hypothetical protein IV093_23625 [Rubrivivax sp.]|nr:hypothetical protein [Rubrivivax sp.]
MNTTSCHRTGRRAFATTFSTALLCGLVLVLPLAAAAGPLAAGSAMPTLHLNDQHDQPALASTSTRWVVFTAEKPVSDMVNAVLSAEPSGVTDRLQVLYVADISRMPALITRMFALPKLRELAFPIALVRDTTQAAQVADIPRVAGGATLLRLDAGRVAQVATARDGAELRTLLGLAAKPATP